MQTGSSMRLQRVKPDGYGWGAIHACGFTHSRAMIARTLCGKSVDPTWVLHQDGATGLGQTLADADLCKGCRRSLLRLKRGGIT